MADVYIAAAVLPPSPHSAPSDVRTVSRGGLDFKAYTPPTEAPPPSEPVNAGSDVRFFGGAGSPSIDQSTEARVYAPPPFVPPPAPAVISVGSLGVTYAGGQGGAPLTASENFIPPASERWAPDLHEPAAAPVGPVTNEPVGSVGVTFSRSMASVSSDSFIPPPVMAVPPWGVPVVAAPQAPVTNEPNTVIAAGPVMIVDSDARLTPETNHEPAVAGMEHAIIAPPGASEPIDTGVDVVMPGAPNGSEPLSVNGVELVVGAKGRPKNVKG